MNAVHLNALDVGLAASLVLLNAGVSLYLKLRLHYQVIWAAIRMVLQLLLVGLLLRWVFQATSAAGTLAIVVFMVAAAAREVAVRPAARFKHGGNYAISATVVTLASFATVLLALLTAIRPEPWYDPRYTIPLVGIVLGSVLNSASLALDTFLSGVASSRAAIEAQLALGATASQAMSELVRNSIRRGMIPVINQMSAAGIITLPGIMTGQLLAGMDPLDAVKYQILLLFLLTGASGLAATAVVYLGARSMTDQRDRLRMDRVLNPLSRAPRH